MYISRYKFFANISVLAFIIDGEWKIQIRDFGVGVASTRVQSALAANTCLELLADQMIVG